MDNDSGMQAASCIPANAPCSAFKPAAFLGALNRRPQRDPMLNQITFFIG